MPDLPPELVLPFRVSIALTILAFMSLLSIAVTLIKAIIRGRLTGLPNYKEFM